MRVLLTQMVVRMKLYTVLEGIPNICCCITNTLIITPAIHAFINRIHSKHIVQYYIQIIHANNNRIVDNILITPLN